MVTDPTGAIGTVVELPDHAAKKGSGRVIPLHEDLRAALAAWRAATRSAGPVIVSERGGPMTPQSIVVWFAVGYRAIGLDGCLSHSGGEPLSLAPRGLFTVPVGHCETFRFWLAIGPFRQLSDTSTATPTLSASSSH